MSIEHIFSMTVQIGSSNLLIRTSSYSSANAARTEAYLIALEDGWKPPLLKTNKWQFWRDTEHPKYIQDALDQFTKSKTK